MARAPIIDESYVRTVCSDDASRSTRNRESSRSVRGVARDSRPGSGHCARKHRDLLEDALPSRGWASRLVGHPGQGSAVQSPRGCCHGAGEKRWGCCQTCCCVVYSAFPVTTVCVAASYRRIHPPLWLAAVRVPTCYLGRCQEGCGVLHGQGGHQCDEAAAGELRG